MCCVPDLSPAPWATTITLSCPWIQPVVGNRDGAPVRRTATHPASAPCCPSIAYVARAGCVRPGPSTMITMRPAPAGCRLSHWAMHRGSTPFLPAARSEKPRRNLKLYIWDAATICCITLAFGMAGTSASGDDHKCASRPRKPDSSHPPRSAAVYTTVLSPSDAVYSSSGGVSGSSFSRALNSPVDKPLYWSLID